MPIHMCIRGAGGMNSASNCVVAAGAVDVAVATAQASDPAATLATATAVHTKKARH